ncbi:MAG: hypothetical protein E7283_05085 [Lachnospiraceae bacterium]|nr:hypothetical protein [Lachnospiraceae bacterium]
MKKITEEQKKKVVHNLTFVMPLTGLVLQVLLVVLPLMIYALTKNWAFLIMMMIAQFGFAPAFLLVCGIIGLICSILALKKICFKKRYVVMIILSALEILLGIGLFLAMPEMLFGIG